MAEDRQELVLMTVRLVAAAFQGEVSADALFDKICDAGMHRELFDHANPTDDSDAAEFGMLTDEFDGDLFDAIDTALSHVWQPDIHN